MMDTTNGGPAPIFNTFKISNEGMMNEQTIAYFYPPSGANSLEFPIVQYRVLAIDTATGKQFSVETENNNAYSPLIIDGLTNGVVYDLQIDAKYSDGTYSDIRTYFGSVFQTPSDLFPKAPGVPQLTQKTTTTLSLEFTEAPLYNYDGTSNLYSYIREQFPRGCAGAPTSVTGNRQVATHTPGIQLPSIEDINLVSGDCYKYRVMTAQYVFSQFGSYYMYGSHSQRSAMIQTDTNSPSQVMLSYNNPPGSNVFTTGFRVKDRAQYNITLFWDTPLDGGAYIKAYHIRFREQGGVLGAHGLGDPLVVTSCHYTASQCEHAVTNLLPKTTYEFSIAAVNEHPETGEDRVAAFSTLQLSACTLPCDANNPPFRARTLDKPNQMSAPTATQDIDDVDYKTTADITWIIPEDNGRPILSITVVITHFPAPYFLPTVFREDVFGPSETSAKIVNLSPRTRYNFTVYASNILGDSDASPSSAQVHTLDVPDAPSHLEEKGKSVTWVEFEFTVPHHYVAPITAYRLLKAVGEADAVIPLEQFQQHGTDFQGSLSTQTGETSNSRTSFRSNSPGNPAFDLDQLTNYHFRIMAVTNIGLSPASDVLFVRTTGKPGTPGVPQVASMTDATITLTWDAANDMGSPIIGHTIRKYTCDAGLACELPPEEIVGARLVTLTWYLPSPQSRYSIQTVQKAVFERDLAMFHDVNASHVNVTHVSINTVQYTLEPSADSNPDEFVSSVGVVCARFELPLYKLYVSQSTEGYIPVADVNVSMPQLYHQIYVSNCASQLLNPSAETYKYYTNSAETQYTITGLNKQTYYKFDVAAMNMPSTVMRTGEATAPTAPVQTQDIAEVTAKPLAAPAGNFAAEISWIKPSTPGDPFVPPILNYSLEIQKFSLEHGEGQFFETGGYIGPSATVHTEENPDKINRLSPTAPLQQQALSLQPGSSYRFRIRARNKYGLSPPSEPSDVVSLPTAVPQPPTDVVVSQIENSSVLLAWNEGHDMGLPIVNHTIIVYKLDASDTEPLFDFPVFFTEANSIARSYPVVGLQALTHFKFAVISTNEQGSSSSTVSSPVRTKGPPSSIPTPTADPNKLSIRQLELEFKMPDNNGAEIFQFDLIFVARNVNDTTPHFRSVSISDTNISPTDSDKRTMVVTDLIPGTEYEFQMAAVNIYGVGQFSSPSIRTESYTLDALGPPKMEFALPQNGTIYAPLGLNNLSTTFDVNMGIGSGSVYVYMAGGRDGMADTLVEEIDVSSPDKIQIQGTTVTFFLNPETIQEDVQEYYVLMDSGAFVDVHRGPQPVFGFPGIHDPKYFHFTTWKRGHVKIGVGSQVHVGSGKLAFASRETEL